MISFLRHDGWVGPQDLSDTLNIIGCGAVGSHVAVLAVRMGFHNIKLWDSDKVESHNIANQAFLSHQVGELKTTALADLLTQINPAVKVETFNRFFDSSIDHPTGPIMIAVDSMVARKDIFNSFYMNPSIPVVCEIRLGFDSGEIWTVNPLDSKESRNWQKGLCNDEDVAESPCNLRICTTLVQFTVSNAVHGLCNYFASVRHKTKWDYDRRLIISYKNKLNLIKV